MRPSLTKTISLTDFQNYYWLKAELQTFCREHGLPASGSKTEITERISHYLTTGKVLKNSSVQKVSKAPLCYEVTFVNSFFTHNIFLMAYKSFRNKIYRQLTTLLFVDWLPQVNGPSLGSYNLTAWITSFYILINSLFIRISAVPEEVSHR
ncbi:hypothetical protein IIU_03928 [Bacillus cereus VD133]|uniref:SAP domain-containing protein n=1 Tax=Bacillus cereus VD133 TaxID=1053233 RepID=A0A9W5V1P6_BACCE|nr:hypothetical protein IIU_03928 [Bacillus cereus VD133]